MTRYKILFKFPTRSRPDKFFAGLNNIINNLDDKENYRILVSIDLDDASMCNRDVLNKLKPYAESNYVVPVFGYSKNKVDAINRDMDKINYPWDIVIIFSDDMEFIKKGFDNIIRKKFYDTFRNLDGNLHYNDGYAKSDVSTMTIMGVKYYKRFNYLYNSEYKSLFCDNEYTLVARKLKKIEYVEERIFVHNHPHNIGGLRDELLNHTESFWNEDEKTFKRRKARNFDLKI